jgi:hypothetical protein
MTTNHIELNNVEVICPNCSHQFGAIPVNVQKRIAELEAQTAQLTASLETASSTVILLKQQQRERRAQLASKKRPIAWINSNELCADIAFRWCKIGSHTTPVYTHPAPTQQPLSVSEVEQILAGWSYEIHGDRARYIVRETEAAHGIKEKL